MLPATTPSIKPAACIILYTMALYGEVACTYLQPSFAGQGIGIMATGTTATAIGGLLLPFFLRVYRKGGILRLPLFAMLFLWPVLGFTPSAFLHRNVAMDYAMALGLGLLLPAVLAMFYQSIPSRQRGWWYGVGLACGRAWRQFIMLLEKTWPPDPGPGYNPWHSFAALFSATAALAPACLCLSPPPFRRGTEDSDHPDYTSLTPSPDDATRRR